MPPSVGSSGLASSSHPVPAGTPLPREFGQRRPAEGDRWPMATAAAVISGLSITLWFALIQGGRMAVGLIGQ
jgi:hypothetical protein